MLLGGGDARRVLAGWGVVATGLALTVSHVLHATAVEETVVTFLVSVLLPLVLSAAVAVAGYGLVQSSMPTRHVLRAAGWCVAGMGTLGVVSTLTAVQQSVGSAAVSEPLFLLANNLSGGAALGLLVGVYDGKRLANAERAREERRRVEFLNRVLRHNLLNGMNVVLGRVETLRDTVDGEAADDLDAIEERSERVVETVEQIRDVVAFLEHSDDSPGPVDLLATLRPAVERAAASHHATWTLESGDVAHSHVRANGLLPDVFENLLTNAVVYRDPEVTRVTVAVEEGPDTLRVRVADDGAPVPDARTDRLFGRTESGPADTVTAFDLYVVDMVVSEYGGDAWATDSDMGGAALVVDLPKARSAAGA